MVRTTLCGSLQAVTARCNGNEPMRTWSHERLLRRPKTKGSLGRRRRDVQGPSGSHLLREPLFGQALRREGPPRRIVSPQEEARISSEARPEGEKATRR